MPKEKVHVPVVEPKTSSCVEYVELGRIVTPQPVFKKDTVFVRVLQICRGNPAETFETEKTWTYDIPWSEIKDEEVVEIKPVRARNAKGQFIANNPNTLENEAWVSPEPAWDKKKSKE